MYLWLLFVFITFTLPWSQHCGIADGAITCDVGILYGSWLEFQLFHFRFRFLTVSWEKQQKPAPATHRGDLEGPIWQTLPQPLWPSWGSKPAEGRSISVFPSLYGSFKQTNKYIYIFKLNSPDYESHHWAFSILIWPFLPLSSKIASFYPG